MIKGIKKAKKVVCQVKKYIERTRLSGKRRASLIMQTGQASDAPLAEDLTLGFSLEKSRYPQSRGYRLIILLQNRVQFGANYFSCPPKIQ